MKKIVFFAVFMSTLMFVCAQNAKPSNNNKAKPSNNSAKLSNADLLKEIQALRLELQESDSLNRAILINITENIDKPRYKMYQTENIYNLLKLDTRTGKVWIVQYGMKDIESGETLINQYGVVDEEIGFDGRYELYPTKNMYNFIMLDLYNGRTYQVQWSTDPDYRFVQRIW